MNKEFSNVRKKCERKRKDVFWVMLLKHQIERGQIRLKPSEDLKGPDY